MSRGSRPCARTKAADRRAARMRTVEVHDILARSARWKWSTNEKWHRRGRLGRAPEKYLYSVISTLRRIGVTRRRVCPVKATEEVRPCECRSERKSGHTRFSRRIRK